MKTKQTRVEKREIGRIGTAPVVVLQGKDEDQATVCLVLEGEPEPGKTKAPTRFFSRKLALIALANTDKLRVFVADPRFDLTAPPPPVVTGTVAPNVESELESLRRELAAYRSQSSGRLSPIAA